MSYTRMALVRPDLVGRSDTPISSTTNTDPLPSATLASSAPAVLPDPQTQFYESQLVREKLSPHSSLVEILSHLQKEATRVLNDSQLNSSERLSRYNQLMTKSSILYKKAKIVSRAASSMNPRNITPHRRRKGRRGEEADDEASSGEDDDMFSTTSHQTPTPSLPGGSGDDEYESQEEEGEEEDTGPIGRQGVMVMDALIQRRVPNTYQKTAMNLYRHLADSDKGRGTINWTPSGELVVHGRRIEGSNIIDLLGDAARKNSLTKKQPLIGQKAFIAAVKRLNPDLKFVRNKESFKSVSSMTGSPFRRRSYSVTPKRKRKANTAQSGTGITPRQLAKLWRTKL